MTASTTMSKIQLSFGLKRPAGAAAAAPAARPAVSAAAARVDDDADVMLDDADNARMIIARQQAALRAQAAAAAVAAVDDSGTHDYDSWKADEDAAQAAKRQREVAAAKQHKESRYIGALLSKAEERKFERDVAYERQQVRERKAEEEVYGVTEVVVTESYKAVLEERRARAAAAAAEEEGAADVSNPLKRNAGAFFRNMLEAQMGAEPTVLDSKKAPVAAPPARESAPPAAAVHVPRDAVRQREQRVGVEVSSSRTEEVVSTAAVDVATAASTIAAAPTAAAAAAASKPKLPPGARRTPPEEIEAARVRAVARIAARQAATAR